jgi:outer membrane protein assembly factor BamB
MDNWCGGQQGNSCSPLAADGNVIVAYEGDFGKKGNCLIVGAFDAATGVEKWVAQAPMAGFNAKTARINLASLNTQLTVLCSCGGGTMGLDPANGKVLWSFDLFEANPETMKQVPARYATSEKTAGDYRKDAMRAPFPGYAPVVWNNYVIDAACVGHNSCTSATWCLKVGAGNVTRAWQTSDVVPLSASKKSHMIARDGKLYLFDSYFPGFTHEYSVSRPYRGEVIGQFQCWDITAGKMLWSSDAFHPDPPGVKRVDTTECLFVLAGAHMILCDSGGLSIGLIQDNGVKVLSRTPFAQPRGRNLAEPVLVGTQLFVRQLDSKPEAGLMPAFGKDGNLICFDLGARK